ncbi:MAG: hypothetical protein QNJ15_09025 [Erythrobacter sp.]|nr:hypothetical protein [Erythrobacter sp.]
MTLGTLLPLILILLAFTEVPLFLKWYSDGKIAKGAAYSMMALSLVLPIAAYVVLTFIVPELGEKPVL